MRIALVADVHANLPALEAALSAVRAHRPDMIVSLGDQVNLGPCPRETLALLGDAGAKLLRGNHERYVLAAMDGDEAYAGANFESLRFNARLLARAELELPETMRVEGVTLCHAMPGDDRFPVNDPEAALPRLLALPRETPAHVVCGHGHNPAHYRLPNLTVDCVGAVGCMDAGCPGVTNYALLDVSAGGAALRPMTAAYDTRPLRGLFKASGMADFCPVMARLICLQMENNFDYLLYFVKGALALSHARGETRVSRETWLDVDARFPWPGGGSTAAFWR